MIPDPVHSSLKGKRLGVSFSSALTRFIKRHHAPYDRGAQIKLYLGHPLYTAVGGVFKFQ